MIAYTLPHPTVLERSLRKRLSSASDSSQWTVFPNKEETAIVAIDSPEQGAIVLGRTAPPAENLFRTLLLIDALKNAQKKNITVVVPYFGYGRHDRAFAAGGSAAAPLILSLLKAADATSLVTVDVHNETIGASGVLSVVNLSMMPLMAAHMKEFGATTIVSPDRGGRARAEAFAIAYGDGAPVIWCEKVRGADGVISSITLQGQCIGDSAIIVDDILDTGGTIEAAANLLRAQGIRRLSLCVTHPLFTGSASERIAHLGFEQIVVTNTIPMRSSVPKLLPMSIIDATNVLLAGLVVTV